jgi:hypothetical protein
LFRVKWFSHLILCRAFLNKKAVIKANKFIITIVAPVGRFSIREKYIPMLTDAIAMIDEITRACLKLFAI